MKKLVIVLGSPSSGKTTIVNAISKDKRYKRLNLGDVMFDIGVRRNIIKNRDQIRYLDNDGISELRTKAVEHISRIDGNVVLDTHATVEQHGRFFPGLPHYMMNHLKHVRGLFYIDATTDELLKRRKKDKSRTREIEDKWLIDTQRDVNLAILSYYASDLNIPLYIIHNKEGKMKDTVRTFSRHLEDAFGER